MLSRLDLPLLLAIAFSLGSIPSGYVIARIYGRDIREHGSGNTGATNVARTLGKRAGLLTLIADMLKGVIAVKLGVLYTHYTDTYAGLNSSYSLAAALGTAALCGHCFSPFLKFAGGKGVATGGAVFLLLAPSQTALALTVFFITVFFSGYVSLGSVLAAMTVPTLLVLGPGESHPMIGLASIFCASIIVLKHRRNLLRLLAGSEVKFEITGNEPKSSSSLPEQNG